MAIIQLARDYSNGQSTVVIKTPRRDSADSLRLNIDKLLQEADYLKSINHPNIVKFIDLFYNQDNVPNLVLEYIDGEDLLNKFKFSPAGEQQTVKWGTQILNALEYIHRSGYIHRDLNPGNILLDRDNNTRLIDFGTVKNSGFSSDTLFYKEGFNIPEVAARGYADERSDIYGVGGTLFYLLTCNRPGFIKGGDIVEILAGKGISQRTAKTVAQALQFDPNFRFQTAAAMRWALLGEYEISE